MSTTAVPLRSSGRDTGILRRESKTVRGGLNMNFERPQSEISLPQADTGVGALMGQPDARSYRISIMDIMSPRPIIKSTEPYSMIALGVTDSRAPSRRIMTATGDELGKKNKRIHDLADNMDSAGLRAAMERDQRRREKKKDADAEKLRKRLERRAEKQRAEDDNEDPFADPFKADPSAKEAASTIGTSRTRSKRRSKQHRRRRSSSASRVELSPRPKKDVRPSTPPPVPAKSEAREAMTATAADKSQWPKRTDSRRPVPAAAAVRKMPSLALTTGSEKYETAPEDDHKETDPASKAPLASGDDGATITRDRIVPEEDPDDAEPPVIARSRHPAHEIPHVAHLYSRQSPLAPKQSFEPVLDISSIEHLEPFSSAVEEPPVVDEPAVEEPTTVNEPVLDFGAVEPPETFAPSETRQVRPSTKETDSAPHSPLLPPDGEEIPGLPFLGSVGDESESPVVSPFAASFPTSFPDVDYAAPAPTVHRDPLLTREARYSSLSPPGPSQHFGSTSSITALPQVPSKADAEVDKPTKRKRGPSFLRSLFRRGSRNRSVSDTAATDREHAGSPLSAGFQHIATQKASGVDSYANTPSGVPTSPFSSRIGSPTGGQSRFKEDLAGLNIRVPNKVRPPSPPESRVNSPYTQITPSSPEYVRGALITPISHPRYSEQSAYDATQDNRRRSQSLNRISNPISKSMASIDSEGSWLTGKPVRGLSNRSAKLRNLGNDLDRTASGSKPQGRKHSGYSSASEENHEPLMAEDHFGLRPSNSVRRPYTEDPTYGGHFSDERSLDTGHMASSEIIARSITRDGPEDVHGSARLSKEFVAKQPELKKGVRVKSSEGLFKSYLAAPADTDDDKSFNEKENSLYEDAQEDTSHENTPLEKEHGEVLRAMSVKRVHRRDGSGAKLIEVSSKTPSTDRVKEDITQ
jgi:hypothetical protein